MLGVLRPPRHSGAFLPHVQRGDCVFSVRCGAIGCFALLFVPLLGQQRFFLCGLVRRCLEPIERLF